MHTSPVSSFSFIWLNTSLCDDCHHMQAPCEVSLWSWISSFWLYRHTFNYVSNLSIALSIGHLSFVFYAWATFWQDEDPHGSDRTVKIVALQMFVSSQMHFIIAIVYMPHSGLTNTVCGENVTLMFSTDTSHDSLLRSGVSWKLHYGVWMASRCTHNPLSMSVLTVLTQICLFIMFRYVQASLCTHEIKGRALLLIEHQREHFAAGSIGDFTHVSQDNQYLTLQQGQHRKHPALLCAAPGTLVCYQQSAIMVYPLHFGTNQSLFKHESVRYTYVRCTHTYTFSEALRCCLKLEN